jgi:hypothetical protein
MGGSVRDIGGIPSKTVARVGPIITLPKLLLLLLLLLLLCPSPTKAPVTPCPHLHQLLHGLLLGGGLAAATAILRVVGTSGAQTGAAAAAGAGAGASRVSWYNAAATWPKTPVHNLQARLNTGHCAACT